MTDVMGFPLDLLLILFAVGMLAGAIDAVAGGGGLLTVPVLLFAGLTPAEALATNKLQSSFGTFSATWHFVRGGHVSLREMAPLIAFTAVGAGTGTTLVQLIDPAFMAEVIPFLLGGIALYFLVSPRATDVDAMARMRPLPFAALCGLGIGFYDGFFGPGTGSFWAIAFVGLLGLGLSKATARTKVVNFTSNVTALAFFIAGGKVVWVVGASMALGQLIGAQIGARLVTRVGARIVRPLLVVMTLAMTAKLLLG